MVNFRRVFTISVLALLITVYILFYMETWTVYTVSPVLERESESECQRETFDGFDNARGTSSGCYLVPNYVHFLRLGLDYISFVDAVCILAAFKNQKPDKIFIHTDSATFRGKYWGVLLDTPGFVESLVIKRVEAPKTIYGRRPNPRWRYYHGGDVARLKILMTYGGIFLDNDSYVVRSLNELRRYEMTLGWMEGASLANQVIIANERARFLKKWLMSYREYNSSLWYYNAGEKPTKEILRLEPELIHREKFLLANHLVTRKLFMENWTEWRTHYAFHLLIGHQYILRNVSSIATYPVVFDEDNIKKYPVTFREMVYEVYPMNRTYDFYES